MHPDKTKIVYCKDDNRKGKYPKVEFDFLGFCFRQRVVKNNKTNKLFRSFSPLASKESIKSMQSETRKLGIGRKAELSLMDIAKICNPILRGWINYYGKYGLNGLRSVLRHFNKILIAWAMRKFKKLKRKRGKATHFIIDIQRKQPELFTHWKFGIGRTVT
jgi:RNA-directed DNA polymerase